MNDYRMLSGLSYLSIIFAPIVFPIIVWGLSKNQVLRRNAKWALLLHLAPGLSLFIVVGVQKNLGVVYNHQVNFSPVAIGVLLLINLMAVACAVILGIKQLLR